MKYIKCFFGYYGNKYKELDYIYKYVPNNLNYFIDAFGGSGVVIINILDKNISKNYIYNDKDTILTNLFKIVKNKKKLQKLIKFFENVEVSEKYYKNIENLNLLKPYIYLYRKHYGFRCGINKALFSIRAGIHAKKRKGYNIMFNEYNKKLQNIEIMNKDYLYFFEKYKNNENVLIYCDPPYMSKSQITPSAYNCNFFIKNYEHLLSLLTNKNYKCKILINCDFNGYIYVYYKKYIKKIYNKKYSCNNGKKYCKRYQVILTNY